MAHFPLMLLSDYFLWHVGKQTVGKPATRIAFILMLTNCFMVEYEIRCFTNTLEKILTCIVYYFWLKQDNRFTLDTVVFTALLTLGFMMRNTSPVGWIPLLLLKIFNQNSFWAYLKAGVFVFVPVCFCCVYLDSLYYWRANTSSTGTTETVQSHEKQFEWTFTSLNFLRINVL